MRLITSAGGTAIGSATYDAEGNRMARSGASTPFGFAGEYTDAESGLLFLRSRLYDPATGQFLSRDPLDAMTREAYHYAGGDPVNATDPSGRESGSLGGPAPIDVVSPVILPPSDGGSFGGGAPVALETTGGGLPDVAPSDGSVADSGACGGSPPVAASGATGSAPPVAQSGATSGAPPVAFEGSSGGSAPVLYPPPPPAPGLGDAISPFTGPVAESGSLATGGAV